MPDGSVINIEHTWPQSKFPKRKSKVQKSDLHHLFPTDTAINNDRANHTFFNLVNSSPITDCPTSKLGYNRTLRQMSFEPPTEHKGNVARALFYFAIRYKGRINDVEEAVLRLWNILDPVDEQELRRNDLIESKQGNRNLFIDNPALADSILNF
jgi:deoxyribonuclease-1